MTRKSIGHKYSISRRSSRSRKITRGGRRSSRSRKITRGGRRSSQRKQLRSQRKQLRSQRKQLRSQHNRNKRRNRKMKGGACTSDDEGDGCELRHFLKDKDTKECVPCPTEANLKAIIIQKNIDFKSLYTFNLKSISCLQPPMIALSSSTSP